MKVNQNQGSIENIKYVGVSVVTPLVFNPNREELDKVLGVERADDYVPKDEFVYVKENVELKQKDKEGNELDSIFCDQLNITVWVKEEKTKKAFPINFTIYNAEDVSSTGKYKFVNQHGKSIYCDSAENLSEYFTHTPGKIKQPLEYRKAFKGEANFLEFLASWTNINPFDNQSSLFVEDTKKFWAGNMKELNSILVDFSTNSVMVNFNVKVKEVSDDQGNTEIKEYNRIATKAFCSGGMMKYFRQYAKNNFKDLNGKAKISGVSMYNLNKFVEDIYGDYGVKDHTFKGELIEYDPNANPVNTDSAIVHDDSSY